MKKEISEYTAYITKQIENGGIDSRFISLLLKRIEFYQHERLVHLIVTMTFAVMTVISFFMVILSGGVGSVLLSLLFLGLTVPYVMHYYFLENSVQALYRLYYRALELCDGE